MVEAKVMAILEESAISKEETILVGVSGGADSVALALLLHEAGYKTCWVHINFHLRGEESDRDQAFVEELNRHYFEGVPLFCVNMQTRAYAKEHKISIEMAARELRYATYRELREQQHCYCVAVGHHADDQVETMLLNLARGTGGAGLCGMPIMNEQHIFRPLLTTTREEIERYLRERHYPFCMDSTNSDTSIKRNLIRHELLPLFEQLNPSFRTTLLKSAGYFREEQEIIQEQADQVLAKLWREEAGFFDLKEITESDHVAFYLRRELRGYGFSLEQVHSLLEERRYAMEKVFRSKDGENALYLYRQRAFLIREKDALWQLLQESYCMPLPTLDKTYALPNGLGTLTLGEGYPSLRLPRSLLESGQLVVRPARKEDSFQPFGMKRGRKSLFRYLGERGIPSAYRGVWPVLELDGLIVALLGVEISEVGRCGDGTPVVHLDFTPTHPRLCGLMELLRGER